MAPVRERKSSIGVMNDMGLDHTSNFEEFIAAAQGWMFRAAILIVGSAEEAEDVVQQSILQLHRSWPMRAKWANPNAYARKVVVNCALAELRRQRRLEAWRTSNRWSTVDPSAEPVIVQRQVLQAALRRLSPRQRAVVVLRHYLDLPEAEVAQLLGCRIGTVKSANARALVALRKDLDGDD